MNTDKKMRTIMLAGALLGAVTAAAQPPGGPPMGPGRAPMEPNRPPVERLYGGAPPGRWWTDPATVQRLGLTADQQQKIESVFQSTRAKLIDLNAALQKEELALEPLLDADHPDDAKVLPQIDRVAEARAELEKTNARMLLSFREVLNREQWRKLEANGRPGPPPPPRQ